MSLKHKRSLILNPTLEIQYCYKTMSHDTPQNIGKIQDKVIYLLSLIRITTSTLYVMKCVIQITDTEILFSQNHYFKYQVHFYVRIYFRRYRPLTTVHSTFKTKD